MVAGGSCQEMGPAVDFFSAPQRVGRRARAETKLAGPKRPFLPPTGGAFTAQGRAVSVGVVSPSVAAIGPHRGHLHNRGTFTVGPYTDFFGNSCDGTTHFAGQWIADYTL